MGTNRSAMIVLALTLAGCGGGGDKSSNGATSPAPGQGSTPTPAPLVTVAPTGPITQTVTAGEPATAALTGKLTATNLASGSSVYLKLRDITGTFATPSPPSAAIDQPFRIEVSTRTQLIAGTYVGQFEVTPCKDAPCVTTYGPTVFIDYRIDVTSLGEWETYQRDATHAGYVPTRVDAARLNLMWEWTPSLEELGDKVRFITRPATNPGLVHVMGGLTSPTLGQMNHSVYTLNEFDGSVTWTAGYTTRTHPIAVSSAPGIVYQLTVNDNASFAALNATTGNLSYRYSNFFRFPWTINPPLLAPSNYGDRSYFFAGDGAKEVHAISQIDGTDLWTRPRAGLQISTPAINATQVLYQGNDTIEILDPDDGTTVASIPDVGSDGTPYPGPSALVLGTRGNAIVNSYNGTTNRSPLSSFDIGARNRVWSTTQSYLPLFAVGDGVVYAGRRGQTVPTLDAIDEADGQVLWTWVPPSSDAQTEMVGNVLLTRNLVFISTEGASSSWVWAIDRDTHQVVWRYPKGGYLTMSGSRTLYVLSGPIGGELQHMSAFREGAKP